MSVPVLEKKLTINEIFHSIQGESYLAGLPFWFVRLTGCHQRCVYCDTEYAFYEGKKQTLDDILRHLQTRACQNVLLTGGEPLLQDNCGLLAEQLLERGYQVCVETGGARDVRAVPRAVVKIMDLKTPDSGECHRNRYDNLEVLEAKDEVKFVVMGQKDLDWSLDAVKQYCLIGRCHVSFSPIDRAFLPVMAEAILASGLPIRLQYQMHKLIWPEKDRGY